MATEYPLININQIDLDALSTYIVQKEKLVYRHGDDVGADDKAMDVDKVGGVISSNIAKAVISDNEKDYGFHPGFNDEELKATLKNRNTVMNAVCLGGRNAEDYMTQEDGNSIGTIQKDMIYAYNAEIEDLRDELYQLRHELQRNSVVQNYGFYNGFSDNFSSVKYVNEQDIVAEITLSNFEGKDTIIIDNDAVKNAFDVNDYICFMSKNNFFCIRQIKEKNNTTFVFNKPLIFTYGGTSSEADGSSLNDTTPLMVLKSKGVIHNGMYKFATEPSLQPGSLFYNGLSDDRKTVTLMLNKVNSGIGYSFRIIGENSNDSNNESYISQQGFLQSFKILVKPEGNPGKLNCYIFDKADLEYFRNPEQFEDCFNNPEEFKLAYKANQPLRFFAKSSVPFNGSNHKQYVTFNFENDGTYPLMSRDQDYNEPVEYIVILTADEVNMPSSTSSGNYYKVLCLQKDTEDGGDLEVNYQLYNYNRLENNDSISALTENDSNDRDLFFQIITREVVDNEPEALQCGLYTAHYHNQNIKTGLYGQKARITVRIKREGKYITNTESTTPLVFKADKSVPVKEDSSYLNKVGNLLLDKDMHKDLQERINVDSDLTKQVEVVIGNNITEVKRTDSNAPQSVQVSKPVFVDNEDKVYRVGLNVAIKARVLDFNRETGELGTTDYDRYILKLVDICKDLDPNSDEFSDRLIFETDMMKTDDNGNLIAYNDFEFQIYWENIYLDNIQTFATDLNVRKEMMGALKDVVLSIDKKFLDGTNA